MIVKICGLRTAEQAIGAAAAGASLLGFVFAPSKRRVSVEEAATIVATLKAHPVGRQVQTVGLFVNESPAVINATLDACDLDFAQLSGDEPLAVAQSLARPLIKALRLDGSQHEQDWIASSAAALLLVDAHVSGSYGGTGTLANWQAAATLARKRRLLLAGGLTAANVAPAIAEVQPAGVDVSSGVETDGTKDLAKIQAFVAAAGQLLTTNG